MKEITVKEHMQELLKDPHFKELHELEHQKFGIVKKIIDYRIKNGLTQKDLAKKAGMSQQHISKIENGEFSSVATLQKVLLFIGYMVKIEAIPLSTKLKNRLEKVLHVR